MASLLRKSSLLVLKEGFLSKRGGILKTWNRKYFMLNRQSLVYFRHEQQGHKESKKGSPQGRVFLNDLLSIEGDGAELLLQTKKHRIRLLAHNEAERDSWLQAIQRARDSEGEAERKDPFRRTLRKLAPGLKRITLTKDPEKGIGCTIKSAGGHIFVNAIIADGPVAITGVIRPDDELLDVNGVGLIGMSVAEVGAVIRDCPQQFLATVRPITNIKKYRPPQHATARVNYNTVGSHLAPPTSSTIHSTNGSSSDSHTLSLDHNGDMQPATSEISLISLEDELSSDDDINPDHV